MPLSDYQRGLREFIGSGLIFSPGAAAIIFNDQGQVLLQLRSDDGKWGLPGGALEPGEEPAEAAVREVREETGLEVVPDRIVGIYCGSDSFHTYPNGDKVAFLAVVVACHMVGGELRLDQDESLELRYFSLDQLPDSLFPRHRTYIEHAKDGAKTTHFRYQGKVITP